MGFFRSVTGVIEAELTSAEPERSLRLISEAGIHLYEISPVGELTYRFRLSRREYKRAKKIAEKLGDTLKTTGHIGIYWTMKGLGKRPVLLACLTVLLCLALSLPSRICFVQVEGNSAIPARLILDRAEDCGICFGASRREVRSEKMKNALLSAIPQLQWAGVNTKGCVAVISVREKTVAEQKVSASPVSRIVAARDAVIVSCTAEQGNLVCKVGQAVKAGDLLVSGYTDCGIAIRATRAVGEIYGRTNRVLTVMTPAEYTCRTGKMGSQRKYALIIGKKRINFYKDSGILGTTCDKMSTVNYLTLPGGFTLPVALVTEQWTEFDHEVCEIADDRAEMILADYTDAYLKQQMLAGKVLRQELDLGAEDGVFTLVGRYACLEMIGREQNEENLLDYGKSD